LADVFRRCERASPVSQFFASLVNSFGWDWRSGLPLIIQCTRRCVKSIALRSSLVRLRASSPAWTAVSQYNSSTNFPRSRAYHEKCRANSRRPSASNRSKSLRAKIGDSMEWSLPESSALSLNTPATAATKPS